MNSSQLVMKRSEVDCFTPTPMTVLSFSRNLLTSGEKSESPLMIDESVDVTFRVTKIERVDHHSDVGGILARLPDVRDLDQLESGFVQSAFESFVTLEIAIRLFHHDVALEQKALDHFANVEGRELRVVRAERDVFQIKKNGHRGLGILSAH